MALRKYHSDTAAYQRVRDLLRGADVLPPMDARALHLASLAYQRNQLPVDLIEQMVALSTEIERLFNTFRAELDGVQCTNNELLEMLGEELDSARRQRIWLALKCQHPNP